MGAPPPIEAERLFVTAHRGPVYMPAARYAERVAREERRFDWSALNESVVALSNHFEYDNPSAADKATAAAPLVRSFMHIIDNGLDHLVNWHLNSVAGSKFQMNSDPWDDKDKPLAGLQRAVQQRVALIDKAEEFISDHDDGEDGEFVLPTSFQSMHEDYTGLADSIERYRTDRDVQQYFQHVPDTYMTELVGRVERFHSYFVRTGRKRDAARSFAEDDFSDQEEDEVLSEEHHVQGHGSEHSDDDETL